MTGYKNGDRVFSQKFNYNPSKGADVTKPFLLDSVVVPPPVKANATTKVGKPVNVTKFSVNLTEYINATTKTADETCKEVVIKVYSNNSFVTSVTNGGFCIVSIVANTELLIPQQEFVMNATFAGTSTIAFATKTTLTPRMLSDWVEQAKTPGATVLVSLKDINKSGISGGDIAAIVIGSVIAAVMIIVAAIFLIRWCTFGMMAPVAAPKMMM